jgi:hypothetical protein
MKQSFDIKRRKKLDVEIETDESDKNILRVTSWITQIGIGNDKKTGMCVGLSKLLLYSC